MRKHGLFTSSLIILCAIFKPTFSAPDLKLPWTADETWQLTCGYGCGLHTDPINAYFSLDFDKPGLEEDGQDQPVLAAASGNVVFTGPNGAYGNCVKIDHGDDYVSMYAHLRYNPSVSGFVYQGQQIGVMGRTGSDDYRDHIHFMLYFEGQCRSTIPESKPEPMSDYNNFTDLQLYTSNNTGIVFASSFDSQSITPLSPFVPGRQVTCMVKFKNEGNVTWQKTPGPDFVVLSSCDQSKIIQESFLNYPFETGLNWIDEFTPCTFSETEVPPGGIATFTFTGRISLNAKPTQMSVPYKAYFGPSHNGAIMDGWGEMHYPIEVNPGWIATKTPLYSCNGFVDNEGINWSQVDYRASGDNWILETIPDGGWSCNDCDRFYRYWYYYEGIQSGNGVSIHFVSDDAIWIYVNGNFIGHWGVGCHGSGCVNGGGGCNPNFQAPDVDITEFLNVGYNSIAVHVTERGGGEYFNMTFNVHPLDISSNAICCLGDGECQEITEFYNGLDCQQDGGNLLLGNWFDCGTFSLCDYPQRKVEGDPLLYFQTGTPIPVVPTELTFNLIDTVERTAYYDLPDSLGGYRLFVNDFIGFLTVAATSSGNPDTVNLTLTEYSFDAPSVDLNFIPTGSNHVRLDTSITAQINGTYVKSSRLVDVTINSVIYNDLFPLSNPIKSKSQIRGYLNDSTGILEVTSNNLNVLPYDPWICGDVNNDGVCCNILDLTFLVDRIFRGGAAPPIPLTADLNGDGLSANILDLTYLVDRLFRGGPQPTCGL